MPTDLPNERSLRRPGTLELDPGSGETVAIDETARLIASSKVEGTAVFDKAGERLGSIHTIMIDKLTGQVAYVVLSTGGLLGIGQFHHPLPWSALAYSVELGGYVLAGDVEALGGAPAQESEVAPLPDPS